MAYEVYRNKHPKLVEFSFGHCWLLMKGFPRWADGWGSMRQSTRPRRRGASSSQASEEAPPESSSVVEGMEDLDSN
jgi:hypothetical protein